MPRTLATLNLDWATGAAKDAPVLEWLAGQVDVIFVQEAKNLHLARIVGRLKLPQTWKVAQSTASAARRGSALMWRRDRVRCTNIGLWLGGISPFTLTRHLCRALDSASYARPLLYISAHDFPRRAGKRAQNRYLRRLKRRTDAAHRKGYGWVVGGDFNRNIADVARYLHGTAHGRGIVGFVTNKSLHVSGLRVDRHPMKVGETDHPAVFITVEG